MTSQVQKEIETLFNSKRHGIVDAVSLVYEVFGDEPLRKIKVLVKGQYLPAEFYSVDALLSNSQKILDMAKLIKDAKLDSLREIFKVRDDKFKKVSDGEGSLIIEPEHKFESDYYSFYNNKNQLVVVVKRPSGDLFYQRLVDQSQLSYVLANQVGFLIVPEADSEGVYTSPDKTLSFSFVGENLQVLNDFSLDR